MVAGHGTPALLGRHHHTSHIEALTVAVIRRIVEKTFHEEVTVLDELAHLGLRVAFRQDDNVDGMGNVLVANPSVIYGQAKVVIVADEIVVGVDGEAHPFHKFIFPCLSVQGDVNLHLGERYNDRFLKTLGEFQGFWGAGPLAIKVLVTLREQKMVRARLKHLDDVVAKLQIVDEVGLRSAPIGFVYEFLEREGGRLVVACQDVVDSQ